MVTQEYDETIKSQEENQHWKEVSTNTSEQGQEDKETQPYGNCSEPERNEYLEKGNKHNKRGLGTEEEEEYPGVSSQKRVKHKAEQMSNENQTRKQEQKETADLNRQKKKEQTQEKHREADNNKEQREE